MNSRSKKDAAPTQQPTAPIVSFHDKVARKFSSRVGKVNVYKGEAFFRDEALEASMVEAGCQDPQCKNFENAIIKKMGPAFQVNNAHPDYQVTVTRPSSMGGLPITHCTYCKGEYNPVDLGLIEEDDAMDIIARVASGETVIREAVANG